LTGLGLLMRARNRHRARDIHGRPRGSDGAWMLRGAALKACSWRGLRVERHEHGNCCNVGGVDQSCQVTVKARSKVRLKIKEIRFSWCDEDDRARGGVDEWRRTEAFARLIHLGSRCAKSYGSKVWTAESEGLGMRVLCAEAAKWYFIARPGVKRSALRAPRGATSRNRVDNLSVGKERNAHVAALCSWVYRPQQLLPPSTGRQTPVMYLASSEARKRDACATSQASPIRPIGLAACLLFSMSSVSAYCVAISR